MAIIDIKSPTQRYKAIADAIRKKNGTTELMHPADMPQAILDIVGGGDDTSLNIAFGDTPPEDTSKLWIKANEPEKVNYGSNIEGVSRVENLPAYLPSMSIAQVPCAARIENNIYIFRYNTVSIYNLDTQEVTDLGVLSSVSAVSTYYCYADGKKIYVFNGATDSNIRVFDSETNTMTTHTISTGFTKGNNAMTKVGNKIYSFGGSASTKILVFDIKTETTTELGVALPRKLSKASCESYGNKIYIFGGYSSTATDGRSEIYVFDTETDTLRTLTTTLPAGCDSIGCCRIGTKIYLFGGECGSRKYNTINVFDVETEIIETLETTLPYADSHIGCYADGTKIYLISGDDYTTSFNVFVLTHQLAQGNIEVETSPLKNKFNIINTDNAKVEIGVENVYIGNENNEAEVVEAYLHNGTNWVLI